MNLPPPDMLPRLSKDLTFTLKHFRLNTKRFFKKEALRHNKTQTATFRANREWVRRLLAHPVLRDDTIKSLNQAMAESGWQITKTEAQWFKASNPGAWQPGWYEVRTDSVPGHAHWEHSESYYQSLRVTYQYTAPSFRDQNKGVNL